MEIEAFNATQKRNCMPTKCTPVKCLINKKLEAILWGLLLTCCPSWVLWLHFLSANTPRAGCKVYSLGK